MGRDRRRYREAQLARQWLTENPRLRAGRALGNGRRYKTIAPVARDYG